MHLHGRAGIQNSVLSRHPSRSLLILVARVCSTSGRLMTLGTYSLSGISFAVLLPLLPTLPSRLNRLPPPLTALDMTFLLPDTKLRPLLLPARLAGAAFSSLSLAAARSADLPRRSWPLPLKNPISSAACPLDAKGAVFGG